MTGNETFAYEHKADRYTGSQVATVEKNANDSCIRLRDLPALIEYARSVDIPEHAAISCDDFSAIFEWQSYNEVHDGTLYDFNVFDDEDDYQAYRVRVAKVND